MLNVFILAAEVQKMNKMFGMVVFTFGNGWIVVNVRFYWFLNYVLATYFSKIGNISFGNISKYYGLFKNFQITLYIR